MRSLRLAAGLAAAALVVTGPASASPPQLPERTDDRRPPGVGGPPSDDEETPRVVMAVVDTFTNPYHEFFHADGPLYDGEEPSAVTDEVLEEFGIGEDQIISLTRSGDFEADFAADQAQFDAIERGEPYWFEGTNVIGVSFRDDGGDPGHLRPDGDANPHGVGVTAAALAANPAGIVVSLDTDPFPAVHPDGRVEAQEWAFAHPAVDMVNTSYGTPVGEPDVHNGFGHLPATYAGVVERGKQHFGAVANTPMPSAIDPTGGPWWSIGVSGYQEGGSEGRQVMSGILADVVGDYTQRLPSCRSCQEGLETVAGTSYASPRAMGTASAVLLSARAEAGHTGGIVTEGVDRPAMVVGDELTLTNWDLRRALEEAAAYPSGGDYDPTQEMPFGTTSTPAVDPAPWSTFGWGLVSPDPEHAVIDEALAHAGVTGQPEREKPLAACAFMTAQMEARIAYWDHVEPASDSAGGDHGDPYERC